MQGLTSRARIYLIACFAVGLLAVGWLARLTPEGLGTSNDWERAAVLGLLAAVCRIFVVQRSKSSYADHLTPAPLFAAFLLLPSPLLIVVVVCAFVPEWIWYKRTWFIQTFHAANWLIALATGRLILLGVTGDDHLRSAAQFPAQVIVVTIATVLGAQMLLFIGFLMFVRGETSRQSGLFAPRKIIVEISLFCSGWSCAAAWLIDPIYGLAALLPLILIFQALRVPNLEDEASTDSKTDLANARHFKSTLEREIERARRRGRPLGLLMCDLDFLRNINNTYGHQVGDNVLVGIAEILRQETVETGLAGRFGGEEFGVFLTNADSVQAEIIAEKIRGRVERTAFRADRSDREVRVTISIGVASFPLDGHNAEILIREADLAVYQAKRNGRNRVVVAGRETRELAAEWAHENLVPRIESPPSPSANPIRRFVREITQSENIPERSSSGPAVHDEPAATATTETAPPVSSSTRMSTATAGFIAAVVAAGLASFALDVGRGSPLSGQSWIALPLFVGLIILSEHLAVNVTQRKTSVTVMLVLATGFLYGGWGTLAAVAAYAVYAKVRNKSLVHRMFFNFGMALLAAESGQLLFLTVRGLFNNGLSTEWFIVAATGAGLVYYAVNHILLSIVRGIVERRDPRRIWIDDYQWLWPHYAVLGALAGAVSLGYMDLGPVGLVALMSPVAMMHLAIKQYQDHSAIHVNELERLNSRLSDSYESTLLALTRALDTRDEETEEHSQRVRRYAQLMGWRLGIVEEELEHMSRGALLHDIGKIGVPDAILLKPARLTD